MAENTVLLVKFLKFAISSTYILIHVGYIPTDALGRSLQPQFLASQKKPVTRSAMANENAVQVVEEKQDLGWLGWCWLSRSPLDLHIQYGIYIYNMCMCIYIICICICICICIYYIILYYVMLCYIMYMFVAFI
jgi:hypothetical protein